MQKNVGSQKFIVFAFDSTTNLPKTGDAANITAYISKDFGAVTALGDTTATEMDSTNAKGYYLFDGTQAESNADIILVSGKSSTSNIVVIGAPSAIFTTPANFTTPWISGGGASVVVGDRTGFSLSGTQTFNNTGTWTGNIVGTLSTLTTYTGNTPQTGDAYAKVSALTFTVANKLDVNIKSVNDVTVTGVGTAGSPWGP